MEQVGDILIILKGYKSRVPYSGGVLVVIVVFNRISILLYFYI